MFRTLFLAVLLTAAMIVPAAFGQDTGNPAGASAPEIKVLMPTGDEMWEIGSSQMITWKLDGPITTDSIQISLVQKTDPNAPVPTSASTMLTTIYKEDPGKWLWEKVAPIGKNYKIEVKAFYPKQVATGASKYFNIVAQELIAKQPVLSPPAVTLMVPNGGERWAVGSTQTITWTLKNIPESSAPGANLPTLTLLLSRDDGKTYSAKLATGLPLSTKDFTWKVTGTMSEKCRVKITVKGLPKKLVEDVSDASFQIMSAVDTPHNAGQEH
jgi:hypothetical protein